MQFSEILKEKKLTQEQAAGELGTSQANVARWAAGQAIPRPEVQIKIMEWSDGKVQPNDWVLNSNN